MKLLKSKFTHFIILYLFLNYTFAQDNFEKGLAVKTNGVEINCLINNKDWIVNPSQFEYKLDENSETKIGTLDEFVSFTVGDSFKYTKETIKVDRNIEQQESNSDFSYQEETLFLKLIVEGTTSLYQIEDGKLSIFFIKDKNSDNIEQLKFKTFYNEKYKLRENNSFRKQLYDAFRSKNIKVEDIKKINYNLQDLKSIFKRYNKSMGSYRVYFQKTKLKYNIYAKAGLSSITYDVQGGDGLVNINFPGQTSFRAGAEFEIVMPYSNDKWSVFATPTYQSYSSESVAGIALSENPSELTNFNSIEYSSLEIPVGVRRYFTTGTSSDFKFYLNAAYVFDIELSSEQIILGENSLVSNNLGLNFMLGGGVQYKDFGIEFLYLTPRDLADDNPGFLSDYKSIAVNLTYKLF